MVIKDFIKRFKNKCECFVELKLPEWIHIAQERFKKYFNRYYTYEEVVTLVANKTGMYNEFEKNWRGSSKPSSHEYYQALIRRLPIESEFDDKYTDIIVRDFESTFGVGSGKYMNNIYIRNKRNKMNYRKFLKKSVNNYLREQRKIQDRGDQPKLINFYKDVDIDYINKLSSSYFSEFDVCQSINEEFEKDPEFDVIGKPDVSPYYYKSYKQHNQMSQYHLRFDSS